jgi:catechol 2,3-dioxygenase-like lactoylglutathione lyase family enzyme
MEPEESLPPAPLTRPPRREPLAIIDHLSFRVRNDLMFAETTTWHALGFERITRPEPKYIGQWLQSGSINVLLYPGKSDPDEWGHIALVPRLGFDFTMSNLDKLPFTITAEDAEPYWGAKRVFIITPAGHRIELLEFSPPARFPGPPITD